MSMRMQMNALVGLIVILESLVRALGPFLFRVLSMEPRICPVSILAILRSLNTKVPSSNREPCGQIYKALRMLLLDGSS